MSNTLVASPTGLYHIMTAAPVDPSATETAQERGARAVRSRQWYPSHTGGWDSVGRVYTGYDYRAAEMAPCTREDEHDGAECIAAHVGDLQDDAGYANFLTMLSGRELLAVARDAASTNPMNRAQAILLELNNRLMLQG